ncbi:hypothetical protein [Segetibacter koreensis]|uniref:hypothetical protein n=1 Tax=Segetibacter koreensis TaxID=398037 RepID=UPI0003739F38|nr:hypothetical protein [Segetibacter koreensis]
MEVRSSADIMEDSGLNPLLNEMNIGRPFHNKDYGNGDVALFFVVNCLPFEAKLRYHFGKKEKALYWDILLDYKEVKAATMERKKAILAESIINSFDILDKYKKLNLDKQKLQQEAKEYFKELNWI